MRKNLFYSRFLKVFEGWLARPAAAEARQPVKNLVLLKVFDCFLRKSLFYLWFLRVFEGWLARPAAVEAGRRPPATLKTLFYLRFLIVFYEKTCFS